MFAGLAATRFQILVVMRAVADRLAELEQRRTIQTAAEHSTVAGKTRAGEILE